MYRIFSFGIYVYQIHKNIYIRFRFQTWNCGNYTHTPRFIRVFSIVKLGKVWKNLEKPGNVSGMG